MTTKTTTPKLNCKVRLEWRHDGVVKHRTTDLKEITPWALPGWNPGDGKPYSGHDASVTFFTPGGEWIWAEGKLWLPTIPSRPATSHWVNLGTLAEVLDVIGESLAGRSPEEIYALA